VAEHGVEVPREQARVAPQGRCEIGHLAVGEEDGEHGAAAADGGGNALPVEKSLHPVAETARSPLEPAVVRVVLEHAERRQSRGHGQRVSGQGSRLIHGTRRREQRHDVRPAAEGPHGHPPADDFPETGQVRPDSREVLEASEAQPEPRDHFVENQDDSPGLGDLPQTLEKTGRGGDEPHVARAGLDNDAGQILPVLSHGGLCRGEIVEGNRDGQFCQSFRDAGASGDAERRDAGARLDQQGVRMAVVAALELEDFLAAGVSPGEPDCAHGRLGPGADHPDKLHGGEGARDPCGHFHLGDSRGPVARSPFGRLGDRAGNGRMGMAQDHGAPGGHVVDVPVAVLVPDPRPRGLPDEEGRRPDGTEGPHGAVHAAGDQRPCRIEQLKRTISFHGSTGNHRVGKRQMAKGIVPPPCA